MNSPKSILPSWPKSAAFAAVIFVTALSRAPRSFAQFTQHNLVSSVPGLADFVDQQLINPWGIAASAASPFWVADNGQNVSTLYNGNGVKQGLVVTMPSANSGPTGVVFSNVAGNFNGDAFLF